MICHVTTNMGLTERMETVISLGMNPETGGMDIDGVRDSIPDTNSNLPIFPLETSVVYPDTKLEFLCKDGNAYSYRVKSKSDMHRIVNEVNFLLDLEKVDAV